MILETSTQGHAVPTFSIFKPFPCVNEKVETIKHCFIGRAEINVEDPPAVIKADDGLVYHAVYDCRLPREKKAKVIISFQQHTYGRFAVIRLAKKGN